MHKVALITGATGGLGIEFAKLFAKDGCHLVLTGRNQEKLEKIRNEMSETYHIKIETITMDLREDTAAQKIYHWLNEKEITVDVLVNNAGFADSGEFVEGDLAKQKEMVQVNVKTLMELSYYLGKDMKVRGKGKILNVASAAAFVPGTLMATYFATKAFVLSFSLALYEELKEYGVTVTAFCPGPVSTEFWETAKAEKSRLVSATAPAPADKVAKRGYRALKKGKAMMRYGWVAIGCDLASRLVTRKWGAKVTKKLNGTLETD